MARTINLGGALLKFVVPLSSIINSLLCPSVLVLYLEVVTMLLYSHYNIVQPATIRRAG